MKLEEKEEEEKKGSIGKILHNTVKFHMNSNLCTGLTYHAKILLSNNLHMTLNTLKLLLGKLSHKIGTLR